MKNFKFHHSVPVITIPTLFFLKFIVLNSFIILEFKLIINYHQSHFFNFILFLTSFHRSFINIIIVFHHF